MNGEWERAEIEREVWKGEMERNVREDFCARSDGKGKMRHCGRGEMD